MGFKDMVKKINWKKILKIALIVLAVIVMIVGIYAAYVLIAYHRIEDDVLLEIENVQPDAQPARLDTEYTVVTYNVGFGAYTPDYSFFMDGGESSWAESEQSVIDTINGAAALVKSLDPDIILLEEIDLDATRSYHVDQSELFEKAFPDYCRNFAINYDSPFLFYPFTQPHGKSLAGMGVYSRLPMTSAVRRSLPISESLSKLVDLDRCYSVSRIPVENGKELVVYAVHLSAYGNSDAVREGQKRMLQADMAEEVAAGNYVICGGDFNHDLLAAEEKGDTESWAYPYPRSYLPEGMDFCLDLLSQEERDALADTCRNADSPYDPTNSLVLTVDGFIISENIEQVSYPPVAPVYATCDNAPVVLAL